MKYAPWLVQKDGGWGDLRIVDSKITSNSIIVKIAGFDSPEAVRIFTGLKIGMHEDQLPDLKNDEFYCTDLIGLKVTNLQNMEFGLVTNIMVTGSNDVLVIQGKKRHLVPYTSEVIIKVNLMEKTILVDWDYDF